MWPETDRGDDGFVQLAGSLVKGAHKAVWSHGFTPYNGLHHAKAETRQT